MASTVVTLNQIFQYRTHGQYTAKTPVLFIMFWNMYQLLLDNECHILLKFNCVSNIYISKLCIPNILFFSWKKASKL